ncbi:MAG: helix-turn-helix domain-containing protein [Dactylosporangium sp.]|nr:helix-turn-helix domain-containing protein [Dactylosporangium sp.]
MSVQEREELRRLAGGAVPVKAADRARIVIGCAEGWSNAAVADWCGTSVITVAKWRGRFVEHRLAGLVDSPRPGRPKVALALSESERAELIRWM